MRIIAGTARSLPLKTIEGMDTRPTTDRIKETLFNMLQNDVPGSYFLDLFAGSGQIGLEAVSRGARYAVFVENNKKACTCIEDNIHFTKFDRSDVSFCGFSQRMSVLLSMRKTLEPLMTGKQNCFRAMSFLLSAAWKESTGLMSFSWILRTSTSMKKKFWNV